jgi:putative FmdB family regulatory protein
MPIYDYECEKCHHQFEVRKSYTEDAAAKCPECKGKAGRIIKTVPVIFKGSGFYVTDQKQSNPASAPEKKVEAVKPAGGDKAAAPAKPGAAAAKTATSAKPAAGAKKE